MIYNLFDKLLRLLITLPVSTTNAERTFSSLKNVKKRLHNKMEDSYLANSLLLQVEQEIDTQYSYEDIMVNFKTRKDRRATTRYYIINGLEPSSTLAD
jgi:transcriptional accessory protein Tex/SPT6